MFHPGLPVARHRAIQAPLLGTFSKHLSLAAYQPQLYQSLQTPYQELRQTQQAVMQQERLRALGQMACGIAHDISKATSLAVLYTKMPAQNPDLSPTAKGRVEAILASCDEAGVPSDPGDPP